MGLVAFFKNNRYYSLIFGLITIFSLSFISWKHNRIRNFDQFTNWLNESEHKCVLAKNIAGTSISVKFQPPLYVVLKDCKEKIALSDNKKHLIDSLVAYQDKMITFLVTISPDKNIPQEKQSTSILSEGVSDQKDFVQRVLSTNFLMEQYMSLYIGNNKYKPLLCIMENLYELSDSRTFVVVFAPEHAEGMNNNQGYIFEYEDPYFGMGKVQFDFIGKSISAAKDIKVAIN